MKTIIKDLDDFANQVGIAKFALTQYIYQANKYYAVFSINKANGKKKRKISAPSKGLKGLQRWILKKVLASEHEEAGCTAYYKGATLRLNAEPHVGKRFVLNIDILDFFPSITAQRVSGLFKKLGYSAKVSWSLTALTTFNGRLPQGSPASPKIANLICKNLDKRLMAFCNSNDFSYTRYSDDITISGPGGVDSKLGAIFSIIESEGFKVNMRKVRVARRNCRQTVTGLTVNQKLNVSRSHRKRIRAIFHQAELAPGLFVHRIDELKGHIGYLDCISGATKNTHKYKAIVNRLEAAK